MADIVTLKLVTGEEIIGTKTTSSSDTVLEKVRAIQVGMTAPGQLGVGLIPFSAACVDGEITVSEHAVVARIAHGKDIEDAYLQQVTGIALPSGGIPRK